jgi:hypothetical protein
MRNLLCTLVGVCIVLTIAVVGRNPMPRPSGRLDLHWTGATFWQAYRLKGRYTVWGLSDGSMSTVSSPPDRTMSSVVLAPGLYSIQLEPGACMYFDQDLQALGYADGEPTSDGCREATPTTTLVLVEPGRQRDVELSLSAFPSEATGGGAEGY